MIQIIDTEDGDAIVAIAFDQDGAEEIVISLNKEEYGSLCYVKGFEPDWFRFAYEDIV